MKLQLLTNNVFIIFDNCVFKIKNSKKTRFWTVSYLHISIIQVEESSQVDLIGQLIVPLHGFSVEFIHMDYMLTLATRQAVSSNPIYMTPVGKSATVERSTLASMRTSIKTEI